MRTIDLILDVAAGICFLFAASKRTSRYDLIAVGLALIVIVRILDLLQPAT